jgi:hypothetical protein
MREWIGLFVLVLVPVAGQGQLAARPWPHPRASWTADVPCVGKPGSGGLRLLPPPDSASRPGCKNARCQQLPGGRLLCACSTDSTRQFVVEGPGNRRVSWAAPAPALFWGDPGYRIMIGDLDQDGRDEVVITQFVSASNGMAVTVDQVEVLDGANPWSPPLQFLNQEFGLRGTFTWSKRDHRCRILATRWQNGVDRHRGGGLYLVGEWHNYRTGELFPDTTRPVLARRYLESFETARANDVNSRSESIPFRWLRSPRTEAIDAMPLEAGTTIDTVRGTITRVADGHITVQVSPDSSRVYTPDYWPWDNPPGDDTSYVALVDTRGGRTYPLDYMPSAAPSLIGRQVAVIGLRRWSASPVLRFIWLLR